MNQTTRLARAVAVGVMVFHAACGHAQQLYPNKPIRFVTPYPPGGGTTVVARLIGQKLTESWGQQVLVDNRGGGNTIIGTEIGARAAADGYTLLFVDTTFTLLPSLYAALPYDINRDFAAVATLARIPFMLVVNTSVAANTLQELIALAKSMPGKLNYASSGSGGQGHLAMEIIALQTGIKMQHVPYKGGGPALVDLLGGQVQLHINVPINLIAHVKSGKLKAMAITGASRLPALPQMPTFSEAGLPNFDVTYWHGLVVPAGTTKPIIAKLSAEIAQILAMADVKERLLNVGADPFVSSAEQFTALIKNDLAKYAKVIKAANIKIDQ